MTEAYLFLRPSPTTAHKPAQAHTLEELENNSPRHKEHKAKTNNRGACDSFQLVTPKPWCFSQFLFKKWGLLTSELMIPRIQSLKAPKPSVM